MFMESMPVSLALLRRLSFCRLQAFHFALFFGASCFVFSRALTFRAGSAAPSLKHGHGTGPF